MVRDRGLLFANDLILCRCIGFVGQAQRFTVLFEKRQLFLNTLVLFWFSLCHLRLYAALHLLFKVGKHRLYFRTGERLLRLLSIFGAFYLFGSLLLDILGTINGLIDGVRCFGETSCTGIVKSSPCFGQTKETGRNSQMSF